MIILRENGLFSDAKKNARSEAECFRCLRCRAVTLIDDASMGDVMWGKDGGTGRRARHEEVAVSWWLQDATTLLGIG